MKNLPCHSIDGVSEIEFNALKACEEDILWKMRETLHKPKLEMHIDYNQGFNKNPKTGSVVVYWSNGNKPMPAQLSGLPAEVDDAVYMFKAKLFRSLIEYRNNND